MFVMSTSDEVDSVADSRLRALEEFEKEKLKVAKAYNKKVQAKSFQVNDLVWKTIFPSGSRDRKFDKWPPSWEGPFKVNRVVPGIHILLRHLKEEVYPRHLMANISKGSIHVYGTELDKYRAGKLGERRKYFVNYLLK
jgi:hypothetical protein